MFALLPLFLVWGSFLNVVAHRIMCRESYLHGRSRCPSCKKILAWYDLIPLISWCFLQGRCRTCRSPISWLYPFIECSTALILFLLFSMVPLPYLSAYIFFVSALIVTMRTDLEYMLISTSMTLALIPAALLLSMLGYLPISLFESTMASIAGYAFLYAVNRIFYFFTHKQGIGQGDMDLLALIGAFTGFMGIWITLLFGSLLGSCAASIYVYSTRSAQSLKIPFGPFLAFGAIIFVLGQAYFKIYIS